ncbi:DUF3052 family protein [Streptomyces sp. NPDC001793]|uniref:DUF3052 family protein n=1 Tax=Streptomyces sp. NPDC001793 TaxID=3154657 RepID=UPI0033213036
MTRPEALDAVLTDLRAHHVDPGPDGFFPALRHIDLLGHLALRFTAEAHHLLAEEIPTTNPSQDALRSSQAAATIGRATAAPQQGQEAFTAAAPGLVRELWALVDAIELLEDGGTIWLLAPKTGRDGNVEPSDVNDAAQTASLAPTKTISIGNDLSGTGLKSGKR